MNGAQRNPSDDSWQGPRAFDDYEVEGPLGHGGMGQVFLGRDVFLDRPVALKVTAASDPNAATRARFLREARAIARLSHPNVVGIYRVGEVQGRPYIAYEFVAGKALSELRTPMPWPRVARIALGIARGLAAAHAAGVLHRDIKPGNVMLTAAGVVKVLDFGLARLVEPEAQPASDLAAPQGAVDPDALTLPGESPSNTAQVRLTHADAVMGTPLYIPPEIWRREPATERSDLYAFGLVLHELLTAQLPHGGRGRELRVDDVLCRDAEPVLSRCPDALPSFAALIDQCLRREPSERPPSAEHVASTLERLCALFVPREDAATSLSEDRDAELVRASMQRSLGASEGIAGRVYDKLFAARPEFRRLFPTDLDAQREKLQHALQLSVEALTDLDRVAPILHDLGQRHASLRLEPEDYQVLGESLVGALSELDPGWTPETAAAWRRAFAFVVSAMRRGEAKGRSADAHTQTGSGDGEENRARAPASGPSGARPPATRYAYVGEVGVAWQVFGARGPDLLLQHGWISHLDHAWRHPRAVGFLRALGGLARVIAFDKRGVGLSERVSEPPRLQACLQDALAVLDAAGSRRAVLFGTADGASAALLLAAVFPERVRGVVCFNAMARLLRAEDYPHGLDPAMLDEATEHFRRRWGDARFAASEAPSLASDPDFCAWYGELLRSAASPGQGLAQLRLNAAYDLRGVLPFVRVPTLVMSRAANALAPLAAGRDLAARIPGARFVELPGADNLPYAGETHPILAALKTFLDDPRLDAPAPSPLTTLALVRADRADSPRLAHAAERFEALGARAIALADPATALYATPWFTDAADLATQLVSASDAASEGLRVVLHADALDLARLQGSPAMEALTSTAAAIARGTTAASELVATLNTATAMRFGDVVHESAGARFVAMRRGG